MKPDHLPAPDDGASQSPHKAREVDAEDYFGTGLFATQAPNHSGAAFAVALVLKLCLLGFVVWALLRAYKG
jgi:hypothetical protein